MIIRFQPYRLRYRQTQSTASEATGDSYVSLMEGLEEMRQGFFVDSSTRVFKLECHERIIFSFF